VTKELDLYIYIIPVFKDERAKRWNLVTQALFPPPPQTKVSHSRRPPFFLPFFYTFTTSYISRSLSLSSPPLFIYFLKSVLKGRAKARPFSHRPLTAETCVRAQLSPCDICAGQSVTGTGFSPSTSIFPCQHHTTKAPYSTLLPDGQTAQSLGTFEQRLARS
jgi:hypothetical protein